MLGAKRNEKLAQRRMVRTSKTGRRRLTVTSLPSQGRNSSDRKSVPNNSYLNIPFLGGGPQIGEQVMQGLQQGFDEKLARQRLQLQQRLNDAQIAHDTALTHHEILQTEFEQETHPDRKRLLASQADEAAIKTKQAQTQLDATKQAALELGIHPSEMITAPGTSPAAAAQPGQMFFPHPDTMK